VDQIEKNFFSFIFPRQISNGQVFFLVLEKMPNFTVDKQLKQIKGLSPHPLIERKENLASQTVPHQGDQMSL
jgi:hypothetical protein